MINEFKIGYYYKFIGNENNYIWWNNDGKIILDGGWHKCIYNDKTCAQFEGIRYYHYWFKEDFIESKYSPKEKVMRLLKKT